MADIPLFPDESNVEQFAAFVDIQKQISAHLLEQQHLYEKIGRINQSIESRVIKRRQNEFRLMNEIRDGMILYNKLVEESATATGKEAEELKNQLNSIEQMIVKNKNHLSLSRQANEFEMELANKRYSEGRKWFDFATTQLKNIVGLKVQEYDMVVKTGEEMIKLGGVTEAYAFTISAIIMMLTGAFGLFKKLDESAWNFRKAMGMTRGEAAVIRKNVESSAIALMHLGVTADSLYTSIVKLGNSMGGVHNVTKALAEDVAIMSAQLNISEETSAGFLRNMAAISKSTMESQSSMMLIAQDMSSAAGVPLAEVMKGVASRSTSTLTMMSRLPNIALRSAIELKRMGTSIDQAARSSRSILNFTDSVNDEMEASVLLGRSINLQRARELAYRRDLEGSTKEILRITKSIDFENLDVFQQEAYAKATGKTVDELLNMLQTDKQLERVKRSGTPQQKEQLALYEKMRTESEKTAKIRAKDTAVLLRTMGNQTRLANISNKWNQILAKAQEWLLPIIDNMLAMVIPAMDIARGLFAWVGAFKVALPLIKKVTVTVGSLVAFISALPMHVANLASKFNKFPIIWNALTNLSVRMLKVWYALETSAIKIGQGIAWVGKALAPVGRFASSVWKFFVNIGSAIGRFVSYLGKMGGIFGKIGGFLGMFGKAIPVIGWVITAFQFIGNLIARMKGIGDAFNESFTKGLWFGIKAIGGAIYDTLVQPFVDAFKWIMSFFGGKSPSVLGMGILNGILSVGSMIYDAITAPFKMAFSWVMDKFAGIGKWVGKLFGKDEPVEKKATAAYVPAVTVSPAGTEIAGTKGTAGAAKPEEKSATLFMTEETGLKMVALLEKILAKDSNISMDGQLLSTNLARQTEFRGGYGVNKVA